jgi:hypothetical protein
MVDLFLTFAAILLLGIVAKIAQVVLFWWQTKRISVRAEGKHVESGRAP